MLKYVLKRVLIFIPTILVISLLTFIIALNTPGDPVELMLNAEQGGQGQSSQKIATERAYQELRHKLGLDLPVFYFTLTSASLPDTLHRIPKKFHRHALEELCDRFGNWQEISTYYRSVITLRETLWRHADIIPDSEDKIQLLENISVLPEKSDTAEIKKLLGEIKSAIQADSSLRTYQVQSGECSKNFEEIIRRARPYKKYIPSVHFHGTKNQYHLWFFGDKPWFEEVPEYAYRSAGFIRGDFGKSYQDKRPVSDVIWDALKWTLIISFLSILISYAVAIPLGVLSAAKKGTSFERTLSTVLFMLYSLPAFWIATLLIIFFGGGDYFDIFPSFGITSLPEDTPIGEYIADVAFHLILPVFCLTYGSFAFLSRQMRGGMLSVIGQDFIRTARAKGASEKRVIWHHAFRNSLLPILTLFANILPALISGSFVIEWIFSIPGMGKITFDGLMARNYPIVYTSMMLTSALTLTGTLLSDILYAVVDPRISFGGKNK